MSCGERFGWGIAMWGQGQWGICCKTQNVLLMSNDYKPPKWSCNHGTWAVSWWNPWWWIARVLKGFPEVATVWTVCVEGFWYGGICHKHLHNIEYMWSYQARSSHEWQVSRFGCNWDGHQSWNHDMTQKYLVVVMGECTVSLNEKQGPLPSWSCGFH